MVISIIGIYLFKLSLRAINFFWYSQRQGRDNYALICFTKFLFTFGFSFLKIRRSYPASDSLTWMLLSTQILVFDYRPKCLCNFLLSRCISALCNLKISSRLSSLKFSNLVFLYYTSLVYAGLDRDNTFGMQGLALCNFNNKLIMSWTFFSHIVRILLLHIRDKSYVHLRYLDSQQV